MFYVHPLPSEFVHFPPPCSSGDGRVDVVAVVFGWDSGELSGGTLTETTLTCLLLLGAAWDDVGVTGFGSPGASLSDWNSVVALVRVIVCAEPSVSPSASDW